METFKPVCIIQIDIIFHSHDYNFSFRVTKNARGLINKWFTIYRSGGGALKILIRHNWLKAEDKVTMLLVRGDFFHFYSWQVETKSFPFSHQQRCHFIFHFISYVIWGFWVFIALKMTFKAHWSASRLQSNKQPCVRWPNRNNFTLQKRIKK